MKNYFIYNVHIYESNFKEEFPGIYKFMNESLIKLGIDRNKYLFTSATCHPYIDIPSYDIILQHKNMECDVEISIRRNNNNRLYLSEITFEFVNGDKHENI